MRTLTIIIFLCITILIACKNKNSSNRDLHKSDTSTTHNKDSILSFENKINLGEDIKEIHAYAKDIYEVEGIIYIDIDLIDIQYKNIDERVVVNNNKKIRTYIIDNSTLIYSTDCNEIKSKQLLAKKESQLEDKSIIIVGKSKSGKMLSLNFGCYE